MLKADWLLAVLFFSISATTAEAALAQEKPPAVRRVTDASATESLARWNNHYVPSLALSNDARVGERSIVGVYGFTQNAIFRAGDKQAWDLTQHAKMRFWAKADKKNDNLLVMLLAKGLQNRRDAVVGLTTEWKQYELPFNRRTFYKNPQGHFRFEHVEAIAFYNNGGFETKIWLDGLEFAKYPPAGSLKPEMFGQDLKAMPDWTFLGNCIRTKAKGLDVAGNCLAIEGCGYAESPKVRVIPGSRYLASGYGRTEGDWQNNSCIKVKWYGKDGKPVWWEFVRRDSFSKQWKKYQKAVIVPRDATHGSVVCHAQATWGKSSFFTGISLTKVRASPLLWDIHFDHLEDGWINDRSAYGNDGRAYCLSLDDLVVSQDGGAINFNNRKAKVRFFQSKSFSPAEHEEYVLVIQFFLEEPVAPRDEAPEKASFNILGAGWNTSIAYVKDGKEGILKTVFYSYRPDGSCTHPTFSLPIEPWKWYRFTLMVNNVERKIEGRLLKDGKDLTTEACRITTGELRDPPLFYVGCLDYPLGGRRAYPWGIWGRVDYIKVYDSIAAYEADQKNIVFGGLAKP